MTELGSLTQSHLKQFQAEHPNAAPEVFAPKTTEKVGEAEFETKVAEIQNELALLATLAQELGIEDMVEFIKKNPDSLLHIGPGFGAATEALRRSGINPQMDIVDVVPAVGELHQQAFGTPESKIHILPPQNNHQPYGFQQYVLENQTEADKVFNTVIGFDIPAEVVVWMLYALKTNHPFFPPGTVGFFTTLQPLVPYVQDAWNEFGMVQEYVKKIDFGDEATGDQVVMRGIEHVFKDDEDEDMASHKRYGYVFKKGSA